MTTRLHLLSAAVLSLAAFSAHADNWTDKDKKLHFAAGAVIGGVTAAVTDQPTGFLVGTAAGLAKEFYDHQHKDRHHVSGKDFIATAAGAFVGSHIPGLVVSRRSVSYSWSF